MDKTVNQQFIDDHVTVKDLHNLRKALAKKKGGIILTAHIGNWELGALILSELGYPLTAIALPHKEKSVNSFFNKQRECLGKLKVVPTNIAVRKCLKKLRDNELVAVVGDRDFFQHGEMINFLGYPTILPKGPAAFSLKTGAPIIPVFFIRDNEEQYVLHICEPVFPDTIMHQDRSEAEKVRQLIGQYIPAVENVIRAYPDQWMMFRDFTAPRPLLQL